MNPAPQQARLPKGYTLKRYSTLSGNRWRVTRADDALIVVNQPNPKIAVDRTLQAIERAERGER